MSKKQFFVAGTDTGVGKTLVSAALLEAANARQLKTLGLKPVAAGCEEVDGELYNEDALILQRAASIKLPYEQVNPLRLRSPVSPHIAANQDGKSPSVDRIAGSCLEALSISHDFAVIEGAGGWRVPINDCETMATLAFQLGLPVILVVGLRLGCLNHALLTAEAIERDGLMLAGWVANTIDPHMLALNENIATLRASFSAPCLGVLPHEPGAPAQRLAKHVDINILLGSDET